MIERVPPNGQDLAATFTPCRVAAVRLVKVLGTNQQSVALPGVEQRGEHESICNDVVSSVENQRVVEVRGFGSSVDDFDNSMGLAVDFGMTNWANLDVGVWAVAPSDDLLHRPSHEGCSCQPCCNPRSKFSTFHFSPTVFAGAYPVPKKVPSAVRAAEGVEKPNN